MSESKLLFDILRGYSEIECGGSLFYFKHPSIFEKVSEIEIESQLRVTGKNIGLLSSEELLNKAIESKVWTEDDEAELKELRRYIGRKRDSVKSLSDPNLIKVYQTQVENDENRIKELRAKKENISAFSLENFVRTKAPAESFKKYVFKDPSFKQSAEDDLCNDLIMSYITSYSELCNLDNMLKCSYNPLFFDLVFLQSSSDGSDLLSIFKKDLYEITLFQKDLLIFAKILNSKIMNLSDIPNHIKEDPIKLYHYKPPDEDNKKKRKHEDSEELNIRKEVEKYKGIENMKPEDKLT